MRLTTGGKNGFGLGGKTDAEIEEMAGRVQLSPDDKLYTHIPNGFIEEAYRDALKQAKSQRDLDRFFLKRMDDLMRTKGLKLLKEAGL